MLETTLGALLREKARTQPDRDFIVYADRDLRFTYRDFDLRVDELAKGFLAIGLKRGDHIGIWATNVPDWNTVLFAAARAGMVLVTVNTAYKTHELSYLMEQSDLACLCIIGGYRDSDYVAMVNELVPELKSAPRGHLAAPKFPFLKSVVYIGQEKHRGMYSLAEVLLLGRHGDPAPLTAPPATPKGSCSPTGTSFPTVTFPNPTLRCTTPTCFTRFFPFTTPITCWRCSSKPSQ